MLLRYKKTVQNEEMLTKEAKEELAESKRETVLVFTANDDKKTVQSIADAEEMLAENLDPEMTELAKEELAESKKQPYLPAN